MDTFVVLSKGPESAALFFPSESFPESLTKFKTEKSHLTATAICPYTHDGKVGYLVNFELTAQGRKNRDIWAMMTTA